jgi:transcriptional regulator with XRE-family HTH domain
MTHSLAEHVAREVRAELARQHVTQRQLGEHLGLSQPQITKRLNGAIEFRPSELEAAADLLRVPVTQFLPTAASAA